MKCVAVFLTLMLSGAVSAQPYVWSANTTIPAPIVQRAAEIAAKVARYPVPKPLPTVYVLTDAAMDAVRPNIHGFVRYNDPGRVFLNADMPADVRFAVLVHEMVHVMQARAGRHPFDCHSNMANELEAYSASSWYLTLSGNSHVPMRVEFSCP